MQRQRRETFEDSGLDDWNDTATSQGILTFTRSWKRQEMDALQEPLSTPWSHHKGTDL